MTAAVTFTVDAPPSLNRIWRHSGKRVYCNPRYVSWRRTAGWQLLAQRPGSLPAGSEIAVTLRIGPAKRKLDADNAAAKQVLDLLQHHQIIANERLVADIRTLRDDTVEAGRVRVELRTIEWRAA
jgi:Holliday junction resolvase RusA-like endonuclease